MLAGPWRHVPAIASPESDSVPVYSPCTAATPSVTAPPSTETRVRAMPKPPWSGLSIVPVSAPSGPTSMWKTIRSSMPWTASVPCQVPTTAASCATHGVASGPSASATSAADPAPRTIDVTILPLLPLGGSGRADRRPNVRCTHGSALPFTRAPVLAGTAPRAVDEAPAQP